MRKAIAVASLGAYLAFLLYLTLFAFLVPASGAGLPPNLTPFATIGHDLRAGGRGMVINLLGNLAAFAPAGVLLPMARGGRTSARTVGLSCLALSVSIEALQYASGRRVADVDDVILNVLGGCLGFAAYAGLGRWWARGVTRPAPRRSSAR